ncbi:MAG: hypothetical protein PHU85_13675 [Phycisphaerae bacterium]|nr:hypothetical protein [Phycisphaerae bacterium]
MDLQGELKRRTRRRRLLAARRYRSRRFWRTISRRRRLVGAVVLVALLSVVGTFMYFTSSARVKRLAENYLTDLTGRIVRIDHARFSPFEGIRLKALRVFAPGEPSSSQEDPKAPTALFKADEVLLELSPGSLLAGRLKVRRIVAVRPEMRRIRDARGGEASYTREDRAEREITIKLPLIELREARYIGITRIAGQPAMKTLDIPLSAELRPDPDIPDLYHISGQAAGRDAIKMTPLSGRVQLRPLRIETNIFIVGSLDQLPGEIEKRIARYHIAPEKVKIKFDYGAGWAQVDFDCQGTEMTLPLSDLTGDDAPKTQPDKAGPGAILKFTDVRGRIVLRVANQPPEGRDEFPPGSISFGVQEEAPGKATAFPGLLHRRPAELLGLAAKEPPGRKSTPLTGKLNGQPFELLGHYDGFSSDAAFQMKLDLRNVTIPRDPAMIATLPGAVGAVLDNYDPAGNVDASVSVRRARRGGPVKTTGVAKLLGISATYWRYPYRLDSVTGTVEFDERLATIHTRATRGRSVVTVDGTAGLRSGGRPLNITVVGKNLPVNKDSLNALSEKQQDLLDRLKDLRVDGGEIDFTTTVTRPADPDSDSDYTFTLDRIAGVNLEFEDFTYPIRIVAGKAEVVDNGVKLANLEVIPQHLVRRGATANPTSRPEMDLIALLMVDGFIGHDDDGRTDVKLEVACSSLPLDETLWRAFPDHVTDALLDYHIDARAGLFATITKKPGSPLNFDVKAQLKGGYLKADDFPYALDSLAGEVHVNPQRVEFRNTSGRHNGVPIAARGQIGLTRDQPTHLSFRSDRLPLDAELKAALPAGTQKTWDQLSPTGWVAVDAVLDQPGVTTQPDRPGGGTRLPATQPAQATQPDRPPMTVVTTITALGNGLCYSEFPYPLERVTGQFVVRSDRIDILEMSDDSGGRLIKMSGTIWPGRDNAGVKLVKDALPAADLKVSVMNLEFDERLRKAVPWQIRRRWNEVLPAGSFDLQLTELRWTPLGASSRWDFAGRADVRNGKGSFGVDLDEVTGQIEGRGTVLTGQASAVAARLSLTKAKVAGRPLSDVTSRLVYDPRDGKLRLDGLNATMYGGLINAFAEITIGERDLPYRLSLGGTEIDLSEMINSGKPAAEQWKMAGKIQGRVTLEGKAGVGSRRGDGEVVLTHAQVYQVPPILVIFGQDKKRMKNPNQSAKLLFYLDGDLVTLEEANLRDPTISLLGTGTMDLATKKIDLTVVAGEPPSNAKGGAKLLEEMISNANAELMRYHLTGLLNKPQVESVPLYTLREAIDELSQARKRYQKDQATSSPATRRPPAPDTAPLPAIPPSQPRR